MSAYKCRHIVNILLDFGNSKKLSKNMVAKALRDLRLSPYNIFNNEHIYTTYEIRVGMYRVNLFIQSPHIYNGCHSLRKFGAFKIEIYEKKDNYWKHILIKTDKRFIQQKWSNNSAFRIKDLNNVITYCHRLNKLKMFL